MRAKSSGASCAVSTRQAGIFLLLLAAVTTLLRTTLVPQVVPHLGLAGAQRDGGLGGGAGSSGGLRPEAEAESEPRQQPPPPRDEAAFALLSAYTSALQPAEVVEPTFLHVPQNHAAAKPDGGADGGNSTEGAAPRRTGIVVLRGELVARPRPLFTDSKRFQEPAPSANAGGGGAGGTGGAVGSEPEPEAVPEPEPRDDPALRAFDPDIADALVELRLQRGADSDHNPARGADIAAGEQVGAEEVGTGLERAQRAEPRAAGAAEAAEAAPLVDDARTVAADATVPRAGAQPASGGGGGGDGRGGEATSVKLLEEVSELHARHTGLDAYAEDRSREGGARLEPHTPDRIFDDHPEGARDAAEQAHAVEGLFDAMLAVRRPARLRRRGARLRQLR